MFADVGAALAAQGYWVRYFLSTGALRWPVVTIWVATFGGALHEPVTPYFRKDLGFSPEDVGAASVIRTLFNFLVTRPRLASCRSVAKSSLMRSGETSTDLLQIRDLCRSR